LESVFLVSVEVGRVAGFQHELLVRQLQAQPGEDVELLLALVLVEELSLRLRRDQHPQRLEVESPGAGEEPCVR
jgi:hypothetical protein